MSALAENRRGYVCCWPIADVLTASPDVRFCGVVRTSQALRAHRASRPKTAPASGVEADADSLIAACISMTLYVPRRLRVAFILAQMTLSASVASYRYSSRRPWPPVRAYCGCLRTNERIARATVLRCAGVGKKGWNAAGPKRSLIRPRETTCTGRGRASLPGTLDLQRDLLFDPTVFHPWHQRPPRQKRPTTRPSG
jgi:hypothetical protein